MYLYRAVDSDGNTLEFLLSPTRDAESAKRFFVTALASTARSVSQACPVAEQVAPPTTPTDTTIITSIPRVITVDKNAAYPKAIAELKATGVLPQHVELRQVKYLNNLIEQDHRCIKRLTKPGMGFFTFETAWRTVQGFEVMNMIRKGQLQCVRKVLFSLPQRRLRVERFRMVNELTGDGNVGRDQSMLAKRQS